MRIYNNMDGQIQFDLTDKYQIVIPGKAFSADFLPNPTALGNLVKCFTPDQIAFLVTGPSEYAACSQIPSSVAPNFIVQSKDEITARFAPKVEEKSEPVLKEKVIEADEIIKQSDEEFANVADEIANADKKPSNKKKNKKATEPAE